MAAEERVLCTLELAPTAKREVLESELQAIGARIFTWDETGRVVTLEAPASELAEIAGAKGIVYLETAERYTR